MISYCKYCYQECCTHPVQEGGRGGGGCDTLAEATRMLLACVPASCLLDVRV